MLEADQVSRKRMIAVGAVLGTLLGGFLVSGLVQRYLPNVTQPAMETEAPDPVELAQQRLRASRFREQRKKLAAIGSKGRWSAAAAEADTLLRKDAESSDGLKYLRAEALLREGDERGAEAMGGLLRGNDPFRLGAAQLLRGDQKAYRDLCAQTIGALDPNNTNPMDANNAAWVAALGPGGLDDYTPAITLAEKAVTGAESINDRWTYLNTLGALQYRAGRDVDAIRSLSEAERLHSDVFNWPFLAMAYARQGNVAKARAYQDRLRKELDDSYATNRLQQSRHELLMFWNEAEEAVRVASPAPVSTASAGAEASTVAPSK